MRDTVRSNYEISVLNTSMPAADIVGMVENALDYAERNGTEDSGIRMRKMLHKDGLKADEIMAATAPGSRSNQKQ